MKKIKLILTAITIAALLSGCGGNETEKSSGETTTATAPEENAETSVYYKADTEEDTTPQSLEFLREKSPLLAKYFEIRTSMPLSMVSQVETADMVYETGIIIKDEQNMAQYSKDSSGNTVRVVFTGDKAYQINESEKIVYSSAVGEFYVKSEIIGNTITLPYNDVSSMEYNEDIASYDGVDYKRATIGSNGTVIAEYYFDNSTEDLKLIVNTGSVTRFSVFENSVYDSSLFDIPSDYEQRDGEELLEAE